MKLQGACATVCVWMVVALLSGVSASASEPWLVLPPTPSLPSARSSGIAQVNGIRLYFARFGRGRPLLLLHGGLANSEYWGNIISPLTAQNFEVIVVDSRGHGRSTRSTAPFSYQLMADDIVKLLGYLQLPRVDLLGWSDGGIIGLDLALRHPACLRRLAIYGSNSDPSGVRPDFASNGVFGTYISRTRFEYERLSPTPHDFDRFVGQIEKMWAVQPRYSPRDLARITTRTLVFDGAHDEAISREHTEYLARAIPNASLVILDDVSHFGMLQNPVEVARTVVDFLLERRRAPAALKLFVRGVGSEP